MFGRGLGGLEQSFLDFCEALLSRGKQITTLVHPQAQTRQELEIIAQEYDRNDNVSNAALTIIPISNFGQWDFIAKSKIRKTLIKTKPDIIIVFGNRAISLTKKPALDIAPICAVTPNYSVSRLIGLEGIFYTTGDLRDHIASFGQETASFFHIPNMIKVPNGHSYENKPYRTPPIIGTMGRFVKKKGFAEFIQSLAELDKMNIDFHAVIGGSGVEEQDLKNRVQELKLNNKITFAGWIENKKDFFESIDIFCLPSNIEPFGIILLEAFMFCKPVVTTDSEGPSQIALHASDALIVPKGDSIAIATALKSVIQDKTLSAKISKNAYDKILKQYDTKVVSEMIVKALEQVIKQYK